MNNPCVCVIAILILCGIATVAGSPIQQVNTEQLDDPVMYSLVNENVMVRQNGTNFSIDFVIGGWQDDYFVQLQFNNTSQNKLISLKNISKGGVCDGAPDSKRECALFVHIKTNTTYSAQLKTILFGKEQFSIIWDTSGKQYSVLEA